MGMVNWANSNTQSKYYPDKHKYKQGLNDFNKYCGGYKIYIQNYAKKGERKFNVVNTKTGEVWRTDDSNLFFYYLRGII